MKTIIKKSIILACLMLSTVAIHAQITYGVQANAALNKSSFETEDDDNLETDWKLGYGVGIFAEIPLSTSFSVRPSLSYQQKGGKMNQDFSIEGVSGTQKAEIKLEYIEMPILLLYNIGKESSKFYVGAGPSFGYGISGKVEMNQTIGGNTETSYFKPFKDVKDGGLGFKQFDFSLRAVIGMRVFEKGMIQLEYTHGLSNVANTDEFKDDKLKNRSLMLTLGYRFK